MRIDLHGFDFSRIAADKTDRQTSIKRNIDPASDDRTSLSHDNTVVKALQDQVLSLPEIRQEKVQAIKAAIDSGTYTIEPSQVADAMIRELAK